MVTESLGVRSHARQWREPRLGFVTAHLAGVGDAVQPVDLALPLEPRRMIVRQAANQGADALAQLQREVRRRCAHELTHVLHGDLVLGLQPIGVLSLAHFCGTTSRRLSICACTGTEMAELSPITQPWL